MDLAPLIVLEIAAANLLGGLTPVGNPQNLFLYTRGGIHAGRVPARPGPLRRGRRGSPGGRGSAARPAAKLRGSGARAPSTSIRGWRAVFCSSSRSDRGRLRGDSWAGAAGALDRGRAPARPPPLSSRLLPGLRLRVSVRRRGRPRAGPAVPRARSRADLRPRPDGPARLRRAALPSWFPTCRRPCCSRRAAHGAGVRGPAHGVNTGGCGTPIASLANLIGAQLYRREGGIAAPSGGSSSRSRPSCSFCCFSAWPCCASE